jgi:hypothetical protein
MAAPSRYKRRVHRRFAAWLVCGPVGHLVAGILDWLDLLGGAARSSLRKDP